MKVTNKYFSRNKMTFQSRSRYKMQSIAVVSLCLFFFTSVVSSSFLVYPPTRFNLPVTLSKPLALTATVKSKQKKDHGCCKGTETSGLYTSAKLRRDGVLNLYPFPRVGRASHTWQLPIKEKLPSPSVLDPESTKRQLYAFPRVGRDMPLEDLYHYIKRQSFEPQSKEVGMWFGPRLGRAYHGDDIEMTDNEAERGEQLEQNVSEREKRNTKEI